MGQGVGANNQHVPQVSCCAERGAEENAMQVAFGSYQCRPSPEMFKKEFPKVWRIISTPDEQRVNARSIRSFLRSLDLPCRWVYAFQKTASELDYVMGGFGVFSIDARDEPDCIAKYINDGRNSHKANVKFIKLKRQRKAIVVAIADISKGSEFFADYGEGYWRKREEGIR
eukprot:GEMP01101516.1.p1 GENE.GEMP01101516.1~~GEMP01101516.1.p1  ORF type:complete len:171 (+),score=28.69 GEMP01101516.1:49-561(+)